MTTQFNRIALEGAVDVVREAYGSNELDVNNEILKDFIGWLIWKCGTRAEAINRLNQAEQTLIRMIVIAETREDVVQPPPVSDLVRKNASRVV